MSIILRGQKGSALTYEELDGNLEQFYTSSSLSSNGRVLSLFTSGGEDTVTFPAADTLQSVTDNGNTTTNAITALSIVKSGSTSDDVLLGDGSTTSLSGIGGSGIFTLTGSVYATTNDLEITGSLGISGSITNTDYIDLTGVAAPYNEGRLFYDQENGALGFYNEEADITLQVGQEFYKRVYNNSGVTITNGTPVYASGSQGDVSTIFPAISQNIYSSSYNADTTSFIGLATHDIENNSIGYVTEKGVVRGINTTAFTAGDRIYLQTGSAGFRDTRPPFPYSVVEVGNVIRSQANGFIEIDPIPALLSENISGIINIELEVQNDELTTITKGTPVHITAEGDGPISLVKIAKASDTNLMPATFITEEDITAGNIGTALSIGYIYDIDTSTYSVGETLYVAPQGGLTATKPTGSDLIQNLGTTIVSNATNGSVFIIGSGRSNDLPNITQGYVWVGNSDGVPVAISTGSLGTGGGVQIFVTGSSGTDSIQTNDSYSSVASANFAFAGGGSNVSASGISSTALGGDTNKALGDYSTVIGGRQNTANFSDSSVFGGRLNISSNLASTVIGGYINSASGESAAVVAGEGNKVKGDYAAIVGGTNHTGSADYSIILGGQDNHTLGIRSAVIGGRGGQAKGSGSVILGGSQNEIDVNGNQSSIIAGSNNTAGHPASSIIAGDNVITSRKFTSFAKSVFVTGSTGEGVADFGGLLQLSRRTTTPQTPEEGMIIHSGSSGASKLYFYNGTNWLVIAGGI